MSRYFCSCKLSQMSPDFHKIIVHWICFPPPPQGPKCGKALGTDTSGRLGGHVMEMNGGLPRVHLHPLVNSYVIGPGRTVRLVANVWEKDICDFQAKSGSSASCPLLFFVTALFSFFFLYGKSHCSRSLGTHLEVLKILLPGIGDRPNCTRTVENPHN